MTRSPREASNGAEPDGAISSALEGFLRDYPWVDTLTIEAQLSLAQAHAVLFSSMSRRYAELGISVSRFNALRLLHHAPERRLTISDLGIRLGVSTASVTRLVDGLIRDGWVRRVSSESDKRITHVELLEGGEARLRTLMPQVLSIWNDLWSGISREDKEQLTKLNSRLRRSILTNFAAEGDLTLREY